MGKKLVSRISENDINIINFQIKGGKIDLEDIGIRNFICLETSTYSKEYFAIIARVLIFMQKYKDDLCVKMEGETKQLLFVDLYNKFSYNELINIRYELSDFLGNTMFYIDDMCN